MQSRRGPVCDKYGMECRASCFYGVLVDVSQVPNARPYVEPTKELVTEWYPK